jgi:hypothetical protein
MSGKWVCAAAGAFLAAVGGIGPVASHKPAPPAVTLDLLETRLTNGWPVAVFRVANAGHRPAELSFDGFDRKLGSEWHSDFPSYPQGLPVLGIFGLCWVGSESNCLVTIQAPSGPGGWRAQAGVALPLTTPQKAEFAALRLWAWLTGRSRAASFWPSQGYLNAYRVLSPEVPGVPQPAAVWEGVPLQLTYTEGGPLQAPTLDWLQDQVPGGFVLPSPQPAAPPNDGLMTPARASEGAGKGRPR